MIVGTEKVYDYEEEIERLLAENERLLSNAKEDARLLLAYSEWCRKNNCLPSSSDLMACLTKRTSITSENSISMAATHNHLLPLQIENEQEKK